MTYIAIILLPIMILCIVLALKGTSVKISDNYITIGFCRYSVTEHTFCAKKVWIRPIKRRLSPRCMVQVAVFQDRQLIRTHFITTPNETAADNLIAKIEKCCIY